MANNARYYADSVKHLDLTITTRAHMAARDAQVYAIAAESQALSEADVIKLTQWAKQCAERALTLTQG